MQISDIWLKEIYVGLFTYLLQCYKCMYTIGEVIM